MYTYIYRNQQHCLVAVTPAPLCGCLSGRTYLPSSHVQVAARKVALRLPGTGNANSHGARPVHQIMLMIKWAPTSWLFSRSL